MYKKFDPVYHQELMKKAMTYDYPEVIPVSCGFLPAAWMKRGKELAELVSEYQDIMLLPDLEHLEENLSLEALGDHFFISKYYAAHEFKERTGMPVHQYIIKKRLERCADEIKTGKAISRIYPDYGFTDYSAFYRAFKKEYHLSPKDYQKVYLHDPMYPGRQK